MVLYVIRDNGFIKVPRHGLQGSRILEKRWSVCKKFRDAPGDQIADLVLANINNL